MSKTKNVPKLTSEISSSLSVIPLPGAGALSLKGMSPTEPTVAADAPPARDRDTPTAPNTGTTSFRLDRFDACFARGMSVLPCLSNECLSPALLVPLESGTGKADRALGL